MLSLNLLVFGIFHLASTAFIEFDENDPIASHPDMKNLARYIADKAERRRGIDTYSGFLNDADRQQILDMHNQIRAEVARGEYVGKTSLPAACNMNELKYSRTLERVADQWSKDNCSPLTNGDGHNTKAEEEVAFVYYDGIFGETWTNP